MSRKAFEKSEVNGRVYKASPIPQCHVVYSKYMTYIYIYDVCIYTYMMYIYIYMIYVYIYINKYMKLYNDVFGVR